MPSSDTSDFSVTSVRFFLEMSNTPSLHDTGESVTLGDTNDVKNVVLTEDVVDSDFLFEQSLDESDLISDGFSSVDLDFEDVILLLSQVLEEVVLSVYNCSHNGGVLSDSVELNVNKFGFFAGGGLISGESFLFGVNPVLVEPSDGSLVEVVSPDGGESSESSWGFNVTN